MSNPLSKLIETPVAQEVRGDESFTSTEAWEPSVKPTGRDGSLLVTTVGTGESNNSSILLREAGFDISHYAIDEKRGIQHKEWDALRRKWIADDSDAGGHYETVKERMQGHRFTVVERVIPIDLSELESVVSKQDRVDAHKELGWGDSVHLVALGDLQLGKLESPWEGVVHRFNEAIEASITEARNSHATEIVIAWMGDCIEGFVSQGGRNAWRTTLTLTEQIRITRRLMLRAIDAYLDAGFADIRVLSVPGNHDEAVRSPVGTRSDDSYALDALIAVGEAMQLNKERYGGVQVLVPGTDGIGVTLELAGVKVAFIHGHQFRPNQHWKWWEGQALGATQYGACDVLFTGHGHHTHIEERAHRTFAMVPSLESKSTWWVQKTGQTGNPGVLTALFKDGQMLNLHKISTHYRMEGE